MKLRLPILVCIILLSVITIDAQNNKAVQVGVQLSSGISTVYSTYPDRNGALIDDLGKLPSLPMITYGANVYLNYRLSDDYNVAFEPGFIRKGYGTEVVSEVDILQNQRVLSYLTLPVLFEYGLTEKWKLSVGPEFNYMIDAKNKTNDGLPPIDINQYFSKNRLDIALQGGSFYQLSQYFDLGVKAAASLNSLESFYVNPSFDESAMIRVNKKNFFIHAFIRLKY